MPDLTRQDAPGAAAGTIQNMASHRLLRAMDVWAERTNGLGTVQELRAMMYVAQRPGVTVKELQARLGMSGPGTTQMLAMLTRKSRGKRPPLDLIRQEVDPQDGRIRQLYLSTKGKMLLGRITEEAIA